MIGYFNCDTCNLVFIGPDEEPPEKTICLMGKCRINKIDEETANRLVEELFVNKRDE